MDLSRRALIVAGLAAALPIGYSSLDRVHAMIRVPDSLDQDFDAADVVAAISVTDYLPQYRHGNRCAIRYTADIVKQFKPRSQAAQIRFGRYDGLAVGHSYLIFLKYVRDRREVYREFEENGIKLDKTQDTSDLIDCNGAIPGFSFDQEMIWEIQNDAVKIVGLLPRSLPSSIAVSEGATAEWFLRKSDVFTYLDQLARRTETKIRD